MTNFSHVNDKVLLIHRCDYFAFTVGLDAVEDYDLCFFQRSDLFDIHYNVGLRAKVSPLMDKILFRIMLLTPI